MTDKTIEQQIAELWPDKCPKCNSPAWIGAVQATCVSKSCPNGSEKEFERYAKLLSKQIDDLIEQAPKPFINRKYTGVWVNPTKLDLPTLDDLKNYDIEDDEPTQPRVKPFDWGNLDDKMELAMRPYGKCQVRRCDCEDAFEVILYNPPTNLYLTEKFTVEFAYHQGAGFPDWLARHVADTFPPRLNSAWDYEQVHDHFDDLVHAHFAKPPEQFETGSAFADWFNNQEHTLNAGEGMTRKLMIGQYIYDHEFRVIRIDRCNDTFTIKRSV